MNRKFSALALILLLVVSAGFAQQPNATPNVEHLRQVITYLASDALEGRRTGTDGANEAAKYIAGEFNRYGLQPILPEVRTRNVKAPIVARYLQGFPFVSSVELGKNNSLTVVTHGVSDVP